MSESTTDNVREALEASYDAVAEADAEAANTPVEAPAEPAAPSEPAAEATTPKTEEKEQGYSQKEEPKREKREITPGPKAGQPKEKVDPVEKAPQAWKPEAREFWKQIPEAARREILRTEQSVQQTLRETVEDRRFAQAMKETVRPFEHFIKAEGSDPIKAVDNLLTTAARLRTGNAQEVAAMVGQIVNQFGTGRFGAEFIRALDSNLAGIAQPQVDPYVAQMEQRMRQMEQQFQNQQNYEYQMLNQNAENEVMAFQQEAEFLADVREEMADLMDLATKRGQSLSLKDAYDRACWANPEIRNVIEQRRERERAQQTNQVTQKARSAAVSVGGSPAFNANQEAGTSIRDAIEFAMRR